MAVHVRRENIKLPLSWHGLTRKRQHELCECIYVRSLAREADRPKWRYSRLYGGGTPRI